MLTGVWERRYADADRVRPQKNSTRVLAGLQKLEQHEFEELLEDISLAA